MLTAHVTEPICTEKPKPGPPVALTFDSYADLFRSMLVDTGDTVVFVGEDLRIIDVNERGCEMHQGSLEDFIGKDCRKLIEPSDRLFFARGIQSLENGDSWVREMHAKRFDDTAFAADVTVRRMAIGDWVFFTVVIRDLTEPMVLKTLLRQERSHRKEMYNTLRNLMKSFEKEKQGLEGGIRHKIESLILPALDKIEGEPLAEVRNAYLDILRGQLVELTKGFTRAIDAPFLKLTRTEMRVCQFIQKGCAGKEIAEAMNISFETVQVHRRNIRKKLGLTGRGVNLFAFLSTKPFLNPAG
jgi:PAS domain S-box-containing protein